MTENKRYFKREWEEEYYIFDSTEISEEKVDEELEYTYNVFADSMQGDEVVDLLNEQEEELKRLRRDKLELEKILSFNDEYFISGEWNKKLGIKHIKKGDNITLTPSMVVNRLNGLSKCNKRIIVKLDEQEEQIKKLEKEKESWKNSACHDMSLKSMLSFEIGKLTETKDIDAFLDFYYKYFCESGDVE